MISYLTGSILHKDLKYLVIQTSGGVGYKVFTTTDTMASLAHEEAASLWIYTAVREDALDLYGFKDKETLGFFELLLTVSGIGPKSALGVLGAASVNSLREAVLTGETAYLTKISGVGKKVAEKIVLELKGKVGEASEFTSAQSGDVDAIEALKALGYTHKEAKDALEGLSKDIKDPGEKVKAALRVLGK